MTKRYETKKERSSQAVLVCGEAFQRVAAEFIPRIGVMKEMSAQALSNEEGDLAACATNLAFAIELYVKGLLVHLNEPVPQTHNLLILYKKIPTAVREIIESVYDKMWPEQASRLRGNVSITLAKGPLGAPKWNDYVKVSMALQDLFARSGNLFQSWRYVYEFNPPEDSAYQFHQYEFGLLWCAAEALRAELTIRIRGAEETPLTNSLIES